MQQNTLPRVAQLGVPEHQRWAGVPEEEQFLKKRAVSYTDFARKVVDRLRPGGAKKAAPRAPRCGGGGEKQEGGKGGAEAQALLALPAAERERRARERKEKAAKQRQVCNRLMNAGKRIFNKKKDDKEKFGKTHDEGAYCDSCQRVSTYRQVDAKIPLRVSCGIVAVSFWGKFAFDWEEAHRACADFPR